VRSLVLDHVIQAFMAAKDKGELPGIPKERGQAKSSSN
jgi:hypothetical protein